LKKSLLSKILAVIFSAGLFGLGFAGQTVQLGNAQTGVALLSQNQNELTMQIDIGALNLVPVSTNEGSFIMLTVDGFARSHNIGEPNLPMVNRVLSIPYGCQLRAEVIDYNIEEISLADYNIIEPVMPAQPSLSKSDDPDFIPFEYNRSAYEQSGYYSQPLVNTEVLGMMRAHRLGVVSIAPVEYNPTQNKIRVYTSLTIRVNFDNADWLTTEQMQRRYYSPYFEAVYNRLFNYNDEYPVILDDLVTYPVKYLIVSDRMFESQLQPFIEWKTKKGFTVITAYTDEIGYTGNQIRTYIENLYDTEVPAPSFVLFVGDDQQIPAFNLGAHISDLPFCEYTNDDIPEIYYGRFSAQNPTLLQPQIDKTLEYEMYTMPDPNYLGEVTLVAGVDAGHAPTWGNGQINYGTDYYFNAAHGIDPNVWLYPASDDPGAGPAIRQTINNGIGLVNYSAHCGHDGWSDPSFTSNDIRGLTNSHKYLLSIGNCCLSNTFGSNESTPCFGETWLQEPNKGGYGHIGGTNSTYWDEDYWWGVGAGPVLAHPTYEQTGLGAYDGLFHDHGEPVTDHYITSDALIFCGNMAVVEGGGMVQYYWEIYHLMGDPSVISYMGVPTANNIVHDPTILLSAPTFTVQAAPGSYVGISMNGVIHGQGYVDETGSVIIPLTVFPQPGAADIVITAQNKIPSIETITVITPDGPYVIFDEYGVNDQSGNNDGQVDFGESILLDMQLVNVGPDTATDVVATLSTDDEYVTITDDTENYGNIAGDFTSVNIEDAFSFDVSNQVPDGHVIHFELTVTGIAADTWTSYFNVVAHAPEIELAEIAIDDAAGNDNGIIEAGETVLVIATLLNSGSTSATSVVGVLTEDDQYITISDANGSFGDIGPNESVDNSGDMFVIVAADDFPPGYSVEFNLALEADGGYGLDVEFAICAIESFEYNDGGWTGAGVWEWGAPTSGPGSAYDGNNVWGTVLGGQYPSNADDALITAEYDLAGSNFTFSYYQWYDFENSYDGGNLHISTDNGATWSLLNPDGGYPDDQVTGLDQEPGFTGSSGGWQLVTVDLGLYCSQTVQIKFRFGTDGSITRDGWYIDGVVVTGDFGDFPACSISPLSFSTELEIDESSILPLTISNEGSADLSYSIMVVTDDLVLTGDDNNNDDYNEDYIEITKYDGLTRYEYTGPKTDNDTPSGGGDVITDFGGPDEYGYTWRDSDEPNGPQFDWVDITGIGNPITGHTDDSNVGPFDIGFEFPFYGNIFTSFRSCSNGWISFTSSSIDYSNDPIPTSTEPNNLLAPFWDDMNFNDGGDAYYYSNGVDSLVISYVNVPHYGSSGQDLYTFQAILLGNGNIIYQYTDIVGSVNSATTGIENESGSVGLQVAHNQGYVTSGLAVKIKHPVFWLIVSPAAGTVQPGQSTDLDVTFDATDMAIGRYYGNIIVSTNDPENTQVSIPCTLSVGQVGIDDYTAIPSAFSLSQNFPNPFNPKTDISFGLPNTDFVTLKVYDIMGRCVKTLVDKRLEAGVHTVIWDGTTDDGSTVTSGVYFYKLSQGDNVITKKMMMLK